MSGKATIVTIIIGMLMLGAGLLGIARIITSIDEENKATQKSQWVSSTEAGGIELITMNHDGHLIIVLNDDYRPTMIHHPGCACLEAN